MLKTQCGYTHQVLSLLKLRDQKQIDYEELTRYLQNASKERDTLVNPLNSEKNVVEKSMDFMWDKYLDVIGTYLLFVADLLLY
jgi:hypothetical protein